MSHENVEQLRRTVVSGRLDFDALCAILAEDVVWDLSRSSFPDAAVYNGIEGARTWLGGLADAFEDISYEEEQMRDCGDRVAALTRVRGRGASTEIGVDYRFAQVWTFRDGKVIRMDRYGSWAEALEAVGLSE